jgi:hypothetical protein
MHADQQISKLFCICETDKSQLNAMAEVISLHSLQKNDRAATTDRKHMTRPLFSTYNGNSQEANMLLPHSILTPF